MTSDKQYPLTAKGAVRRALTSRVATPLWNALFSRQGTVLMMHRFSRVGESSKGRHSIQSLRKNLDFLRRNRYHIEPLSALVERLCLGERPLRNTVCFTIDDGYRDIVELAAPVFAEFDVAATVFLVTGWIDGAVWLWYDAVRFAIQSHSSASISIRVEHDTTELTWSDQDSRAAIIADVITGLKEKPTEYVEEFVRNLCDALSVTLPSRPPDAMAPLRWDEVRSLERQGLEFGPHSYSHPVFSQSSSNRVLEEVSRSVGDLARNVARPIPVFCYPNGRAVDFTAATNDLLRSRGMLAAVSAVEGYVTSATLSRDPFILPRIPYRDPHSAFRYATSGLGKLRQAGSSL